MIKKLILSIILYFALAGTAGAFSTGTLILSNFGDTNTSTICNNVTSKCYFLKTSDLVYNANGTLIFNSSYGIRNVFVYDKYIIFFSTQTDGASIIYVLNTLLDTYNSLTYVNSSGYPKNYITSDTSGNVRIIVGYSTTDGYRLYGVNSSGLYLIGNNTNLTTLLTSNNITNTTFYDFYSSLGYNKFVYLIDDYLYFSNANDFSKVNISGNQTKTTFVNPIGLSVNGYNFFKSKDGKIYFSYSTIQYTAGTYIYSNTYYNNVITPIGNKYYFYDYNNTGLLPSVSSIDYNSSYTGSKYIIALPIYNPSSSNFSLNYIAKDLGLYSTDNYGNGESVGGSGTGGTGGSTTTGTGGSTTTKEKDTQTCNLKSFTGVLSGTGTNEINYNFLSTGSQAGTLYSSGNPIIQSQLSNTDLFNLFNENQISFTGSQFDGGTLLGTQISYRANNILGYPKTIDIYIGEPISSAYSTSNFTNIYLRGDDGVLYQTPNFIGTYGNKYTLRISDNVKITSMVFTIEGFNNKIPSLQKIKFYGENTSQTKTRYECTYNEKFCGWDTYYSAQKKSYCIENGDFNQIRDEYIGETETTETFFDFSPITDGLNAIKETLTGTGTGTGGTIASGSIFGTGAITFSSGAGNFTSLAGVGTGVDCSNMFVNGVFQYNYGTKTNFMSFVGWDLFSKLGFQRWEVKIFGVNLIGWVYDLLNVTCSSISNLLLYAFNLLFNNFDFIYYLFNEPVRGQDYCYFGIKLKVYPVWETNHFGTTNKREFDYFVTIFIILSLLYLIIRK